MALFLAGTVVGGVAVGAIFLGSLATANRLVPPERRGHAISAFFVACCTGLIVPVVGVGDTLLHGPIADQAALHGVLAQIEALGLELLEVHRVSPASSVRWAKARRAWPGCPP